MKRYNTGDAQQRPPVVMLVYGQGGVGKSTFASSAPKPIMADCENGAKYFGLRGIKMDVALIERWSDVNDFFMQVKGSDYETVVIDPIGELMDKLKVHLLEQKDAKLVQRDGSLTMAGWGYMKDKMRAFIKACRDLNKHLIIVAHLVEKDDDGRIVKRPMVATKISEELINMVDVVGYFTVVRSGDEDKRVIYVQPSDRYEAKDRTQQLGPIVEPDFTKIVAACQGSEVFSWSSPKAKDAAKAAADAAASAAGGKVDAPAGAPEGAAAEPAADKTDEEISEGIDATVEAANEGVSTEDVQAKLDQVI